MELHAGLHINQVRMAAGSPTRRGASRRAAQHPPKVLLPQAPGRGAEARAHCMMSYCLNEALKRSVRASSSSLLDAHAFQSALHHQAGGRARGVEAAAERGTTSPHEAHTAATSRSPGCSASPLHHTALRWRTHPPVRQPRQPRQHLPPVVEREALAVGDGVHQAAAVGQQRHKVLAVAHCSKQASTHGSKRGGGAQRTEGECREALRGWDSGLGSEWHLRPTRSPLPLHPPGAPHLHSGAAPGSPHPLPPALANV